MQAKRLVNGCPIVWLNCQLEPHWVVYGSVSAMEEATCWCPGPWLCSGLQVFVWVSGSRSHPVERTQSGINANGLKGLTITHSVTLGGPHPFWEHWFLPWQEEVLITSSWGVKVKGGVRSVYSQFQNQKITCLSPLGIHGSVVQHVADFLISQPRTEESWLSVEGLSWVPHLWNG